MNFLADPDAHPVIGHRGMAACAPENTLEAMELAFGYGADAVEFDLRLSADGEVVVFHDPTVERTTDGSGEVASKSYAQLRGLNAGARFVPGFVEDRVPPPARARDGSVYPEYLGAGSREEKVFRIPLFREVLERFPEKHLLIEIKTPAAARPTLALIKEFGAEARCMIDSYNGETLKIFHDSGIPVGAGKQGVVKLLKSFFLFRSAGIAYDGMCVPTRYRNIPLPVRILSRIARADRKTIHIWTINSPSEARALWKLGVNGIVTDDVRPLLASRVKA